MFLELLIEYVIIMMVFLEHTVVVLAANLKLNTVTTFALRQLELEYKNLKTA
jgi:hypothetical protein